MSTEHDHQRGTSRAADHGQQLGPSVSRRDFLSRSYNGLGALALGGMLHAELSAAEPAAAGPPREPMAMAARPPHLQARAKHCIFLFLGGGVSQFDTFDYKPALEKYRGQRLPPNAAVSGASGQTHVSPPFGPQPVPLSPLWRVWPDDVRTLSALGAVRRRDGIRLRRESRQ